MNLLILSSIDSFAMNLMRCIGSKHRVHVMGVGDHGATQRSRYCRNFVSFDPSYPMPREERLQLVSEYCAKHRIEIILAADAWMAKVLASIKQGLADGPKIYPIADLETIEMLNDKWLFSRFLKQHSLPHPETELLTRIEDVRGLRISFPVIVKALRLGDGLGIAKIDDTGCLEKWFGSEKLAAFPSIAQRYIPGDDFGLNVLAWKGRIIAQTIQKHDSLTSLRFIENETISELGRKIILASNYTGVANFDLRQDSSDGSFCFIECNPRFWGSLRASMRNGVNFVDLGIQLANGEKVETPRSKGITYVLPTRILRELKNGRLSGLRALSLASLADFFQIILDARSFFYLLKKRSLPLNGVRMQAGVFTKAAKNA
jgi:predicted ATP-grasp superfamily ATP-dependent carboligase